MSNISLVHNQYEYEKAIAKNEKNIYVQECCCTEEGISYSLLLLLKAVEKLL